MDNKRERFYVLATEDEPGFPALRGGCYDIEMWSDLAAAVKEAKETVADSEQAADCLIVCELVPLRRVVRVAVSKLATEFCLPAEDDGVSDG